MLWEHTSVVICSKFITFAVTKTTPLSDRPLSQGCDLLKIHYLCGDKDNGHPNKCYWSDVVICSKFITFAVTKTTSQPSTKAEAGLWFAQNSLPLRWQRQRTAGHHWQRVVVICSKFITFAVTKTTKAILLHLLSLLWFAQNSLPLRWQIQQWFTTVVSTVSCDLLKIHYLCGDKYN